MLNLPDRVEMRFFYKKGRYLNREGQKLTLEEQAELRELLPPVGVGSTMLAEALATEYSLWNPRPTETVAIKYKTNTTTMQNVVAVSDGELYEYLWPAPKKRGNMNWAGRRKSGMAPGYEDVE